MIKLSILLNILFLFFFLTRFLRFKSNNKFINFVAYMFACFIVILFNNGMLTAVNKFIMFLLLYVETIIVFHGTVVKKTALFLIAYLIIGIGEPFSILFVRFFHLNSLIENQYILALVIFLVCQLICYALAYVCLIIRKMIKAKIPKIYALLYLPGLVTLLYLISFGDYQTLFDEDNQTFLSILIFLLIIVLSVTLIQIYNIKMLNLKKDLEMAELNQKYLSSKHAYLMNMYNSNFNFLHDLLHTCSNLLNFYNDKNYILLEKELNLLSDSVYNKFNAIYSNSVALSVVLNNRQGDISKYGIFVSTTCLESELNYLSFEDQINFFDEMINLAIRVSKEYEGNKFILIKTSNRGHSIIVKFTISSDSIESYEEVKKVVEGLDKKFDIISDITFNQSNHLIDIVYNLKNVEFSRKMNDC